MLAVRTKLVAGCIIVFLIVSCETALPSSGGDAESPDPTLPRVILDTRYTAPTGATIIVPAGGDFQAALNNAQPGNQIVLTAGATYVGPFTLPVKSGTGWIIIRSSAADANLPAEGQRMKPTYAALLPKLVSPNSGPALRTAPGAHHFRFVGVEVTVTDAVSTNYGLVLLGDGSSAQNSLSQLPHDLILDRTYVHGNSITNLSRCVALNSASTAVIDSYLSECHAQGYDAQAICGWNGPGPFKIVDNYLEGSGENVMFGGADPTIRDLIPSDIEIRRNYFFKPLTWRVGDPSYAGIHWTIKNLLELKLGNRVLIQGNVFENSWGDAQSGYALVVWSVNQEGTAPWSITQDVWIRENIVRHAAGGLQLTQTGTEIPGATDGPTQRIRFDNNIWDDINTVRWGATAWLLSIGSVTQMNAIKFYHQTAFQDNGTATIDGITQQFTFANNIVALGTYGIRSNDRPQGKPTLDAHMPGYLFAGNVVIGGGGNQVTGNAYPATAADVGFVSYNNGNGGDYHLTANSAYKAYGTDGKAPGADIDAVLGATAGVDQ